MKKLLKDLSSFIKSQEKLIMQANKIDVDSKGDKVSVSEIINALNIDEDFVYYGKHKSKYKNDNYMITNVYDSYGTIGIDCENNLVYPIIRAVAMCIFTHNKAIINIDEGKNYATINMIVILINKFMGAAKMGECVSINQEPSIKFYMNSSKIDKIIIISSYDYYCYNVRHCTVPCSFYDMSEPTAIITDESYSKFVESLDSEIEVLTTIDLKSKHRITRIKDLTEGINYINEKNAKNKVILFSSNQDEAIKFMNFCKASLVFVNVASSNISMPNFNQMDFLFIKSMVSPN